MSSRSSRSARPDGMGRHRIVLTRRLPARVEQAARAGFDAILNEDDKPFSPAEIMARCAEADALLCSPTERIDRPLIEALPSSLRIIATYSAGTDHIDLPAAARKGISVTNTPDVLTEATAEIAILLMLGARRNAW